MFLRFVVPEIDEDSERELGVFQAIHKLRKSGVLSGYEEGQDASCSFSATRNQETPRFEATRRIRKYPLRILAISWGPWEAR